MGEVGGISVTWNFMMFCPQHCANTPCASDLRVAGVAGGPMTRIRAVWLAEQAVPTVFVY
jgi:hypothetical protein